MLLKSRSYLFIVVALVGFLNVDVVHSLVEGLYCGVENCYDGIYNNKKLKYLLSSFL
jgi:hypothetical protein